jgi:hypothetical protein
VSRERLSPRTEHVRHTSEQGDQNRSPRVCIGVAREPGRPLERGDGAFGLSDVFSLQVREDRCDRSRCAADELELRKDPRSIRRRAPTSSRPANRAIASGVNDTWRCRCSSWAAARKPAP